MAFIKANAPNISLESLEAIFSFSRYDTLRIASTPPKLSVTNNYGGLPFAIQTFSSSTGLPISNIVQDATSFPTAIAPINLLDYSTCIALVGRLSNRFDNIAIKNIRSALTFINPSYLGDLLSHLEKVFFDKFPTGKIIVV